MSYGELTAIRVWGAGVDRSYGIDRSRAVDPGEFLDRFAGYAPTHADWWVTRHTEIADRLDGPGSNVESAIIISELLDEWRYDEERYSMRTWTTPDQVRRNDRERGVFACGGNGRTFPAR